MAEDSIRLEIVTPESQVFHQMVEWFYAPAQIGPTAIEAGHAPMVTSLVPGILSLRREGREEVLVVGEGFLEIRDNEAEILVHSAELLEEIDVERAKAAMERALRRLEQPGENLDLVRAEAALTRARIRLKAKGAL